MRPRTHRRKRGERVPSYDKSIQGHPRRKEGEERKKERKKERGRERERREKKKAGVPSYEKSSSDTPKKERGDPEYSIQEKTKKQSKKGGGLSSRQVPMNLEQTSAAAATYAVPTWLAALTAAVT